MNCRKCGNQSTFEYYIVCDKCHSRKENLPTNVDSSSWVRILNPKEKEGENHLAKDKKLRNLILTNFNSRNIIPDPRRKVVIIDNKLEIPVNEAAIDDLAKRSGLVVGKWLIHASPENIDEVWNIVASSTLNGELGIDAKVSTSLQGGSEHVMCVYTRNYFDQDDVKRVRKRLAELGFAKRLYYKPDIYTYLRIYRKTFPDIRVSRYAE